VAEGEIGQHQPDQAVNGPDVEPPVEKGDLHRLFCRIHGFRCAGRRRRVVQHRLRHTEKQQRDAVAGGEQHGEPGRETVLRVGVIGTELDMAPTGEGHTDDKHQEKSHRQHVEPAEGGGDVGEGGTENLAGQLGIADGAEHQQQDHHHRRYEHRNEDGGSGFGGSVCLAHGRVSLIRGIVGGGHWPDSQWNQGSRRYPVMCRTNSLWQPAPRRRSLVEVPEPDRLLAGAGRGCLRSHRCSGWRPGSSQPVPQWPVQGRTQPSSEAMENACFRRFVDHTKKPAIRLY